MMDNILLNQRGNLAATILNCMETPYASDATGFAPFGEPAFASLPGFLLPHPALPESTLQPKNQRLAQKLEFSPRTTLRPDAPIAEQARMND
jgi:hypothetical protein